MLTDFLYNACFRRHIGRWQKLLLLDDYTAKKRPWRRLERCGFVVGDQKRSRSLRVRGHAFSGTISAKTHAEEPYFLLTIGACRTLRVFVVHAAHDAEGGEQNEHDNPCLACGHDRLLQVERADARSTIHANKSPCTVCFLISSLIHCGFLASRLSIQHGFSRTASAAHDG